MTIWTPRIEREGRPRYLAIADAIAEDVAKGVLEEGDRLPTHRDLAEELGVTVGTVSRGYAEAERRGLTVGEVGRGTFVRTTAQDHIEASGWRSPRPEDGEEVIDMSLACPWIPPDGEDGRLLARTLEQVARESRADDLLRYDPDGAMHRHRAAAADWIRVMGHDVSPDNVVVTAGAQHAMTVILATLFRAGDTVLTGELTYPGFKAVAQMLGLRMVGVPLDGEGLVPEALERVAAEASARGLYCVPTLQNPTCASMSEARRRAVAEVARAADLIVLEDEIHFGLDDARTPPVARFAPDRTLHITTLSKWATFGLRVGFVTGPARAVERLRSGVRSTMWMPPALMVEVATRWLRDGTAERMAERKRSELEARHEIVREVLGGYRIDSHPHSLHAWLHLPDPWRSDEFVAQARQRGVLIAGAEAFAVGRDDVPHAVRIAVAPVPYREQLRRGLETLADLLAGRSEPCVKII